MDADRDRAAAASARGCVDVAGDDLDAELAFVATPLGAVAEIARGLLATPSRRTDLVVTDVSGVKAPVASAVDHPRFVGGHPMAGSEQSGLDGADPELFTGAAWVLTPTPGTDLDVYGRVQAVIASFGADVVTLSPEDHDRLVAVVSHVPHLVAAALVNTATAEAEHAAALLRLAAGGFRDMTRVAAGQPGIWPDVCADNSPAIVATLDRVIEDLTVFRKRVAERDRAGILEILERASTARRRLPAPSTRPSHLAELRVPVPDRKGVLAEITAVAGDLGLNIYDVEIAHSAEGPRGVLILIVDAERAGDMRDAVRHRGYRCTTEVLR
jgi:prephenate dehydrogenase